MSLSNNKNALFGKASDSSAQVSTTRPQSKTASLTASMGKASSSMSASRPAALPSLSGPAKAKKIQEAQEWSEQGRKHLQKTMFKWTPDHLAAAPLFEKSAGAYQVAGELELAKLMYVQSSESYELSDSFATSAVALAKAAQISETTANFQEASDLHKKAALAWGMYGDLVKSAESLVKAAKELEDFNPTEAVETYKLACERMCPLETPKERMSTFHPQCLDILRETFKYLVRQEKFQEAIELGTRMISIFEAFENENSMCKVMFSLTILYLFTGDVVKADTVYLQEHLNSSAYINSKECRLAESFIMAFKNFDLDMLDKAQASSDMHYIDREIQDIARRLSLLASSKPSKRVNPVDVSPAAAELFGVSEKGAVSLAADVTNTSETDLSLQLAKTSLASEPSVAYVEDEDEIDLT